jgi:flagellar hook-length control protein FliK
VEAAIRPPEQKRTPRSSRRGEGEERPEEAIALFALTASPAEEPTAVPAEEASATPGARALENASDVPAFKNPAAPDIQEPSLPVLAKQPGNITDKLYSPGDPLPRARFAPPEAAALLTNRLEAAPVPTAADEEGRQALAQLLGETEPPVAEELREVLPQAMDMRARLAALTQEVRRTALTDGETAPPLPETEAEGTTAQPVVAADTEAQNGKTAAEGSSAGQPETARTAATQRADSAREYAGLISLLQTQSPETLAGSVPSEPTVSPSQIIRQIVETTAFSQTGSISQIRLQLNPEFLGRVNIVLTATADGLAARIHAQSDAARELLSANLAQLQSELKQAGVNMKSIDIVQPGLSGQTRGGMGQSWDGSDENSRQELYESWGQPRPVTIARFRQMARVPLVSAYDHADYVGSTGVDFRA